SFDRPELFVTDSEEAVPVDATAFRRICREVLVDNVRGQAPGWTDGDLDLVEFTMRRLSFGDGRAEIEYRGRAEMRDADRAYAPKVYGRATWNLQRRRFERFRLVAIGPREGASPFNQRREDPGPAPMGVALVLSPNR
ncbi:MAG: hypothetical protein AAFU79_29425, partial [Myxococcota bacterium]